ncbi:TPA: helix-turn-helix transcriptional regulator [Clostridioides difficile]|uniref:helix-turn-helix domain-containing protein n=1 Tax=Clostridioides difficile TaxID=1496 RepID=UPI000D1D69F5|nr:helix-turn-helix transcriptional regulator [Clostridioides difficile]EGT4969104.1 XRE family transcriptional regulator [Clostridioides difficile]MCP8432002.1 helix-turn-helix transcriptional regulator [Clostridioides difficile]MDI2924657.1 helix-turn-helix transcriptional regulator [Clostridioides difficile]MDI6362406.1 helix-turn-helix transcriptional regulator [Clostridioides difficile]NJA12921.1 helix-turn-helix transcriptional regulator [Clostridioides difficile]
MKELSKFRKKLGLTQKQLAERIGISKSYYSKIEGNFKKPGRGFLEKFKNTFPNEDMNIFFKQ